MKKTLIALLTISILASCNVFKNTAINEAEEIVLEEFESNKFSSDEETKNSNKEEVDTDYKIVDISKASFGTYPAIFLDLTTDKLVTVNKKDFEQQAANFKKALYIEPRDPELNIFDAQSKRTKIILLPISFNFVTPEYISSHSFMSGNELNNTQIKKGVVFGTKFFDGSIYKFEIVEFNKDQQKITLKYLQL